MSFHSGLDLGENNDYTALAVIQITGYDEDGQPLLMVRHLERVKDMLYPAVVMMVKNRLIRPPIWLRTELVVDATGPGRGPADMFQVIGLNFKGMIIHGGEKESEEQTKAGAMYYNVPKKTLVASALIPFQQGRLKITPRLPLAETIKNELRGFRLKQNTKTGHESFSHREGEHDDLVLAVAMASWSAHRFGSAVVDETLSETITPYKDDVGFSYENVNDLYEHGHFPY